MTVEQDRPAAPTGPVVFIDGLAGGGITCPTCRTVRSLGVPDCPFCTIQQHWLRDADERGRH